MLDPNALVPAYALAYQSSSSNVDRLIDSVTDFEE